MTMTMTMTIGVAMYYFMVWVDKEFKKGLSGGSGSECILWFCHKVVGAYNTRGWKSAGGQPSISRVVGPQGLAMWTPHMGWFGLPCSMVASEKSGGLQEGWDVM